MLTENESKKKCMVEMSVGKQNEQKKMRKRRKDEFRAWKPNPKVKTSEIGNKLIQ